MGILTTCPFFNNITMAMLSFSVYEIDFFILDNNNPKTLVIFDQSTYLEEPEKPLYSIKLPGYSEAIFVPYTPDKINIVNSNSLGLTGASCIAELSDLPDGVYEITQMVCPYNELFKTQLYLKTTKLQCLYDKLLLEQDLKLSCVPEGTLEKELIHIDILIQSAKAEAKNFNPLKAQEKYSTALLAVNQLQKRLNCKK